MTTVENKQQWTLFDAKSNKTIGQGHIPCPYWKYRSCCGQEEDKEHENRLMQRGKVAWSSSWKSTVILVDSTSYTFDFEPVQSWTSAWRLEHSSSRVHIILGNLITIQPEIRSIGCQPWPSVRDEASKYIAENKLQLALWCSSWVQ